MTIRIKDKKCEILKNIPRPNENYFERVPGKFWCYTSQESQEFRASEDGGAYYDERRLFIFNPGTQIQTGDMITYRERDFIADRVDTADDYRGDVFVHGAIVPGEVLNEKFKHDPE